MKIEFRDVQCGYEKGHPIQRFVNFTVESGEVCCVLGPNGCGKSTLFKTLLGLLPLQGGRISYDGEDMTRWSPKKLADHVAYVSQGHTPPFPYRVRDVVMLGRINKLGIVGQPSAEDLLVVENCLMDMGVYHLRDQAYTGISGGELQLVMIARALAQQPEVLVLDEPTAALDYGNAMRVISKVRELASKGYAIIMTTHSPDHAFMCNSNVVLLQKSQPMKFGRAVDVITDKNMRSAYGVGVRVVEFVDDDCEVMRLCAPRFEKKKPQDSPDGAGEVASK